MKNNTKNKIPCTNIMIVICTVALFSFWTLDSAYAESNTSVDPKRQIQIDRFELRIDDINTKIDQTTTRMTNSYTALEKAKSINNTEKIQNIQERISNQETRISDLENRIFKYQNMIDVLQGDLVSFDNISTTIDLEIASFMNRIDKFSTDQEKIEKLNRQFYQKYEYLKTAFEDSLNTELPNVLGADYNTLTTSEKSDMVSYIVSEKFKIAMQNKIENDATSNVRGISYFGFEFELLPIASASSEPEPVCNDIPDIREIVQVHDDVYGNYNPFQFLLGGNNITNFTSIHLSEISDAYEPSSCDFRYKITFIDEDHPNVAIDIMYDGIRIIEYGSVEDIEAFYIIDGDILFIDVLDHDRYNHSGSGSQGFRDLDDDVYGYHIAETESFSNTIYVNTWNHMMSTIDTNPNMRKASPSYSVQ